MGLSFDTSKNSTRSNNNISQKSDKKNSDSTTTIKMGALASMNLNPCSKMIIIADSGWK